MTVGTLRGPFSFSSLAPKTLPVVDFAIRASEAPFNGVMAGGAGTIWSPRVSIPWDQFTASHWRVVIQGFWSADPGAPGAVFIADHDAADAQVYSDVFRQVAENSYALSWAAVPVLAVDRRYTIGAVGDGAKNLTCYRVAIQVRRTA